MKPQSRKKTPKTRRPKPLNVRRLAFPEAKGRVVEMVELFTDPAFPCVSIRFEDSTDLTVVIDPVLTFRASFSKWRKGDGRVLKRWPTVRSE